MTNGSIRPRRGVVNSRPGAAWTLVVATWALGAIPAVLADEEPLEVTLQVLDDVSTIQGVLMPLEEEPEHGASTDSPPPTEPPPSTEAASEEDR